MNFLVLLELKVKKVQDPLDNDIWNVLVEMFCAHMNGKHLVKDLSVDVMVVPQVAIQVP